MVDLLVLSLLGASLPGAGVGRGMIVTLRTKGPVQRSVHVCLFPQRYRSWPVEMAQWVRAPAAKLSNLSLIPGIHTVQGENKVTL